MLYIYIYKMYYSISFYYFMCILKSILHKDIVFYCALFWYKNWNSLKKIIIINTFMWEHT